ncbi:MAG: hypothetical protein A2033_16520 [Bacteroidetes bacterium GWA2_31_9]|nr:MAG: hypothetical protein A2033_16520 [Bacteroidetes bacterium GWA2_31_9]
MKQFSIEVHDSKVSFFIELMKSLSFVRVKENELKFELSAVQKAELDKRFIEYQQNPDSFEKWEDVCKKIESRL